MADLKKEEWLDFAMLVKNLESSMKKAFHATMFNWACLMNNAYREKNPEPHVHWHFKPRYNHKVNFAGTTFEDPEFGEHYSRERKQKVSREVEVKIIEAIRKNL